MPLAPCLMLMMTQQSHLHQPWRLAICNSLTHLAYSWHSITELQWRVIKKVLLRDDPGALGSRSK